MAAVAAEESVVVASCDPIPASDKPGADPPHAAARARYEEIAERRLCHRRNAERRRPGAVVIEVGEEISLKDRPARLGGPEPGHHRRSRRRSAAGAGDRLRSGVSSGRARPSTSSRRWPATATPSNLLERPRAHRINPAARQRRSASAAASNRAPGGIRLRARERFVVEVDREFPFTHPAVKTVDTRWAGRPHVQWAGSCAFTRRQASGIRRMGCSASSTGCCSGSSEQPQATSIPSAARCTRRSIYSYNFDLPLVVARADAPPVDGRWIGLAALNVVSARRLDIVGWTSFHSPPYPRAAALAVLLPSL